MFRNLQIRSKLGAILVLPLVALIVFASLQVGSSVARRSEANRTNRLTGLAVRLTALTDALQTERATSTGYVASQKAKFRPEMMKARTQTDRATTALRDGVNDLDLGDYSQRLQSDVADTTRRLDGLGSWRNLLDGADLPVVTRVESFYGELLQSLLTVIADAGNEPGSRSVKADIAALVEISRAKEAASQSTSLLFAALIKHSFGPGEYQRFATLVGEESSSVARFESIASPAQQIQFEHRVAGASNSSLGEVMRQAALAGPGQPPSLNPQLWLNTMSSKVAAFHQVELRVASDVAAAATSDRNAAVRQTVLTTIIMILVVALALGLSLLLANSMAQPLYALEKSARDVASEHLPGVVERLQRPDAQVDEAGIEAMAASGGVPIRSRDEIGRVAEAFNSVHEVAIRIAAEQAALRNSIGAMFLNLARRSQRLVDRQLELIDELERDEADPDALENLFKLDHLATRMRRNAEDLIVLSGAEPPRRWSQPVPLPQVVRGAVAEVEDYQRIELLPIDDVGVVGHAVADVIHLLAELLENATSFSPPGTSVRVAGQPAATGYVVEIEDRGLGMSDEELLDANQRLANPPVVDFAVSRMLGLFVVGRLAQRYGIRVQLRHSWYGGVTALVLIPSALLTWSGMPSQEAELPASRPELVPPGQDGRPSAQPSTPITPPPPPVTTPQGADAPRERPAEQPVPQAARPSGPPPEARPAGSPPQAGPERQAGPPPRERTDQPVPRDPLEQPASRDPLDQPVPRERIDEPVPPLTRTAAQAPSSPVAGANGTEAQRAGDRLPIFEQARSDWFDSPGGPSYLPLRRHAPQSGEETPSAPGSGPARQRTQPQAPPRQQPPPQPQQQPQPAASRQAARARMQNDDPTAVPLPRVDPGAFGQGRPTPPPPGGGPGAQPPFGQRPGGPVPGGPPPVGRGPGMPPSPGGPPPAVPPGQGAGRGPAPGAPAPGAPEANRLTRTGLPRRVPRANLAPGIAATAPSPQPAGEQGRHLPRQVSRAARSPEDVRAMLSSYRSGLERGRRMAAGPQAPRYQGGDDEMGDGPNGAEEHR
jgi:Nitrate and nitrite sensing/HAMP domain